MSCSLTAYYSTLLTQLYTVSTGAITAGAALATFIVQVSHYHSATYGGIYFITSRL